MEVDKKKFFCLLDLTTLNSKGNVEVDKKKILLPVGPNDTE